jgi:hypothetical protein
VWFLLQLLHFFLATAAAAAAVSIIVKECTVCSQFIGMLIERTSWFG